MNDTLGVATISVVSAIRDAELFEPLFGGDSWLRWRVFLAALFGLALSDDDLTIFRHHTGRQTAPTRPFREAALVVGRRGAKSRILALIAVYLGCFLEYRVAPGEVPVIAIIAADRRQARVLLKYVVGTLSAVPVLAAMIDGEPLAESVTLTTGVVIEIHTAGIAAPRGRTFAAVLADELAFWADENSSNPDAEVIAAVRPGLASIPTSMLIMASSPYSRRGVLWETFRRHFGKDDARVLVWRGTTLEMNPTLDPAIVSEAYDSDQASAAAEYGAEFRSDISGFVDRAVIDAAIVPGRGQLPRLSGNNYIGFVDPSGGSADSMTLAIAHRDKDGRGILDALRERRPPFSPEAVVEEFAALLKTYGVRLVRGDRYAGEWPRERFRVHGIEYEPCEKPKSDLYRDLLPILNSGQAELLDIPRLATQLCGLERRTARGGRDSIDHAPGGHDDIANSVAGALVVALGSQERRIVITPMLGQKIAAAYRRPRLEDLRW